MQDQLSEVLDVPGHAAIGRDRSMVSWGPQFLSVSSAVQAPIVHASYAALQPSCLRISNHNGIVFVAALQFRLVYGQKCISNLQRSDRFKVSFDTW